MMYAILFLALAAAPDARDADARAALALAAATADSPQPAPSRHEYHWRRLDDDSSQIALYDHGRQVGSWTYQYGYYRPLVAGVWGERTSPPYDVPPRRAPDAAPTLRAAPGPLYLPAFGQGGAYCPPGASS